MPATTILPHVFVVALSIPFLLVVAIDGQTKMHPGSLAVMSWRVRSRVSFHNNLAMKRMRRPPVLVVVVVVVDVF
jgi:hypothetical protein